MALKSLDLGLVEMMTMYLSLFPKSKQDFLILKIFLSILLLCLTSPNFRLLIPLSLPLFIPFTQWGRHDERIFPTLVDPIVSYLWTEGACLLLLTWPPNNLCLTSVIARWRILSKHYPSFTAYLESTQFVCSARPISDWLSGLRWAKMFRWVGFVIRSQLAILDS